MINVNVDSILKEFRKEGYRLTRSREEIFKVLNSSKTHMSVDDIYLAIKKKGHNVGLTTIYRAVDSLTKIGALRRIDLSSERSYYEIIRKKPCGHHHHLLCRVCQRIIEYSNFSEKEIQLVKQMEALVSKAHNFKIEDHHIAFTGICKSCK